jgi:hypothetical protein
MVMLGGGCDVAASKRQILVMVTYLMTQFDKAANYLCIEAFWHTPEIIRGSSSHPSLELRKTKGVSRPDVHIMPQHDAPFWRYAGCKILESYQRISGSPCGL